MSLVLQSSGGGSITINEPATASNFTQTLPAATGTVMVSGNQPAFSAYSSTTQNISNSTWTKVAINTEEFDTNSNFDTTTNRFTPTVAGYYQINGTISFGATTTFPTTTRTGIYKNGSLYRVSQINVTVGQVNPQLLNSALLFLNGSTDYVELYGFVSGATGPQMDGGQTITSFNGSLVRGA
jgi:hypothetical protein